MSGATGPRLRLFIAALLLVYCAKQVLTVVLFPPFTGHDEVRPETSSYVRTGFHAGRRADLPARSELKKSLRSGKTV